MRTVVKIIMKIKLCILDSDDDRDGDDVGESNDDGSDYNDDDKSDDDGDVDKSDDDVNGCRNRWSNPICIMHYTNITPFLRKNCQVEDFFTPLFLSRPLFGRIWSSRGPSRPGAGKWWQA